MKTHNCLREKLAILDSGLDDRIMEIYKLILFSRFLETKPAAGTIEMLYFRTHDGAKWVQVLGDGNPAGAFEFSGELYDHLCDAYLPSLGDIRDAQPMIDRRWATIFMAKTRNDSTGG